MWGVYSLLWYTIYIYIYIYIYSNYSNLKRGLSSNYWWLRSANYVKITEKMWFRVKMFTNGINIDLPLRAGVETFLISIKESVVVIKEGYDDSLLGYERIDHWYVLEKKCFLLRTLLAKFALFIECPLYMFKSGLKSFLWYIWVFFIFLWNTNRKE